MRNSTIYAIVILIGGYVALQMVADITAVKMAHVWGVNLPAGSLVFAFTFTWRDMIHKRLGRDWARAAILTAAFANVFMAVSFVIAVELAPAGFWGGQAAFADVLAIVPRITIASIIAELISEMTDTEVYHYTLSRIPERHQWARVMCSNAISAPTDAVCFTLLAFAGTMPVSGLWSIIWGGMVFKWAIGFVSIPLIYTIPRKSILSESQESVA